MLKEYLDTSLLRTLNQCIRMSIKNTPQRPLFDFCRNKAHDLIVGVVAKVDSLRNVVRALERNSMMNLIEDLHTPPVICTWPERFDYEPSFGKAEMEWLE